MRRTINTDSAYLSALMGASAGLSAAWTVLHVHGLPSTVMSHSGTAAVLGGFTVGASLLTIGFIEMESDHQ